MLLAVQNAAYMHIYQENHALRAQLDAQKDLVIFYKNQVSSLPAVNLATKSSTTPNSIPSNASSHSSDELPHLPPPVYQKKDFPNTRFWTRAEFIEASRLLEEKGERAFYLSFLVDEEGVYVGDAVVKQMSAFFKTLCNDLYHHREDPPTWKAKTSAANTFVRSMMCKEYEFLCYGQNFWKFEAFAVEKYPDWVAKSKHGRGNLPSREFLINSISILSRSSR
ncbi:hypothetical protein CPC08DRAFT_532091 [Agrocybe pediades]|nr:hypothetical protein CPC08DRAFT_532091 [Agrocybe pediades]